MCQRFFCHKMEKTAQSIGIRAKAWLDGRRDFDLGVEIYNELSPEGDLSFLLSLGESSFAIEQLVEALTPLVKTEKKKAPKNNSEEPGTRIYDPKKLPVELRRRHDDIGALYTKIKYLFARLDLLPEDDRSELCGSIVYADRRIIEHYRHIDAYLATGKQLEEKDQDTVPDQIRQVFEMFREWTTYPQYISKYKKDPNKKLEVQRRVERLEYIKRCIDEGRIIEMT